MHAPTPWHRSRTLALVVLYLVVATASWVLYCHRMDAVEFRTYYAAASELAKGSSPYPTLGTQALLGGHAYVYPLLTAGLTVPLTLLPLTMATAAFRIILLGSLGLSGWIAGGKWGLALASIGLLSTPGITALQVGSLEPIFLLALVCALRWGRAPLRLGITLGLVCLAKLFLFPTLLWLLSTRRFRAFWIASATFVLLFLGGAVLTPGIVHYLQILLRLGRYETGTGWSLPGVLSTFGLPHLVGEALCGIAATGVSVWILSRGDLRSNDEVVWGLTILISLALSPIVWSHYFLLALLPLFWSRSRSLVLLLGTLSWALETPDTISVSFLPAGVAAIVLVGALSFWLVSKGSTEPRTRAVPWVSLGLGGIERRITDLYLDNKAVVVIELLGLTMASLRPLAPAGVIVQTQVLASIAYLSIRLSRSHQANYLQTPALGEASQA